MFLLGFDRLISEKFVEESSRKTLLLSSPRQAAKCLETTAYQVNQKHPHRTTGLVRLTDIACTYHD